VDAGAKLRENARVRSAEGTTVYVADEAIAASVLIGADGVNGIVGRELDLGRHRQFGVALEGNVSHTHVSSQRYAHRLVLEFGVVAGGYGWIFPKGDHLNVGVGGWEREGPMLRGKLARLCSEHWINADAHTNPCATRGRRLGGEGGARPISASRVLARAPASDVAGHRTTRNRGAPYTQRRPRTRTTTGTRVGGTRAPVRRSRSAVSNAAVDWLKRLPPCADMQGMDLTPLLRTAVEIGESDV